MSNGAIWAREVVMVHFSAGDQVIIRFGRRQDQQGTIVECRPGHVYKVRAKDGSVHYFTDKGLARAAEPVKHDAE
jgi:hypothetical protein